MRSVVFLETAQADLLDIQTYIARSSGLEVVADKFIQQLRAACHKFASIPGVIGKARPEYRSDILSATFKNYVIFFRYQDEQFEIVNIIEGHRDIDAFFDADNP